MYLAYFKPNLLSKQYADVCYYMLGLTAKQPTCDFNRVIFHKIVLP